MLYRSSLLAVIGSCCLVVVLSGCSSTSFVGRQLSNFTAYYNGFYNAKQAFREGENSIENNQEPIDTNVYLSLFPQSQGSAGQNFDDAISKSADLLRNHPQSKWVDAALLLIGKSYYYQENYVGSEQKFREVINLASGLEDEARFWLARTLMASGEYAEAIDLVQERLSAVDEIDEWAAKMQMALGELYVHQQEWEQAAEALEQGLAEMNDNRLGARGQFLLGQVYETLNAYGKAADAYDRVQEFNPVYELSYAAQVSYARVVGRHEDPERALRVISDMQRDDKHYEKRGELALLRARVLQAAGQPYDARRLYETVLYGDRELSAQGGQDVRQRVYYRLAELYRDELNSYPMAAAYFDSAATGRGGAASNDEQDVQYTPDAIVRVNEQASRYREFTSQIQEVNRMDSLLHIGSLDQAEFDSVIQQIRVKRAQEAQERVERRREQEARDNFQSRSQSLQSESGNSQRTSGGQSAVAAARSGDSGFLFHDNPVQLQQNRSKFRMTWGERPLVPNWRRSAAIRGQSGSDLAEEGEAFPLSREEQETAMLPPVDTSAVPRDSAARAEMRGQRAEMWYRLGNTLFLQMNEPDSAATWYRKVITDDEMRPVAQRAYYALSEVYRAQGDTAAARRLYQQIAEKYPSSSFARRARARLEGTSDEGVVLDSLQRAREAYREAYEKWQEDQAYGEAVDRMLTVARSFTTTPVAPRALLAAGYIYLEWAERDSLSPRSAIPLGEPSLCCGGITGLAGLQQAEDTTETLPDSLFAQPVYLKTLYASLEDSYPGTPHADRARQLRKSIYSPAQPDSAAADSLMAPADSAVASDTTGAVQQDSRRSQQSEVAEDAGLQRQESGASNAAAEPPRDTLGQPPADSAAVEDADPSRDSAASGSAADQPPPPESPEDSRSVPDSSEGVENEMP